MYTVMYTVKLRGLQNTGEGLFPPLEIGVVAMHILNKLIWRSLNYWTKAI